MRSEQKAPDGGEWTQANGVRHWLEVCGAGAHTIVFVHGLLLASESYDHQVAAFRDRYRIVRYDLRGQGRSEKPRRGLDIDTLADDAAAIIDAHGGGGAHLVGFSMGAFIAMRVAARRPDCVRSLTLIGPSASAEDPAKIPRYDRLIAVTKLLGARPFAGVMLKILFGDAFLDAPENRAAIRKWRAKLERLPRSVARAAHASARRQAIQDELAAIRAPTLVVSGAEDRPISPREARVVHEGIRGSQLSVFEKTGHAVMIERPTAFNEVLARFLAEIDAVAR